MNKLPILLLMGLLSLTTQPVKAGFTFIDSLKIVPEHPRSGDSVTLFAYIVVTWGSPVNTKYHSYIDHTSTSINVYSCYLMGANPEVYYVIDTIPLGVFNAGNYTIRYILKEPFSWEVDSAQDCMAYQYYDSAFAGFLVDPGLFTPNLSDVKLDVYYNGKSQVLQCKSPISNNAMLEIFSVNGQLLVQSFIALSDFAIDVSYLPPGVYFLHLNNGSQKLFRRFVKQL
jgi:hypothetical protein